jgi:iron complex outermembrane receptor protein
MTHLRFLTLAASVSAAALSFGNSACAQASAEPQAGAESSQLEEIVVTARRRQESLQAVPIAVTALGGDELARRDVRGGADLQNVVPSFNVNSAFGRESGFVSIRGFGTTYSGTVANPGVTSYFAEVATPGGLVTPATYFDLQNVQVLKGPQGTLFGRNSLGGAVLFEPRRPGNQFGGFITGVLGNYDRREVEGAVDVPLIEDKLLVRIAGQVARRDGYQKDYLTGVDYNNREYESGRVSVLWRPTDNIENLAIYSHLHSKNNGTGYVLSYVNMQGLPGLYLAATTFLGTPVNLGTALAQQDARGPYSVATNSRPQGLTEVNTFQDTLTWRASDNITVKNIASYSRMRQIWAREDYDGTQYPFFDTVRTPVPLLLPNGTGGLISPAQGINKTGDYINQKTFSEELQVQGQFFGDALQLTSGVYYQKDKPATYGVNILEYYLAPGQTQATNATLTATSAETKSVYAQGTWDFGKMSDSLSGLKLTVGGRHTWDKVTGVSNSFRIPYPNAFSAALPAATAVLGPNNIVTQTFAGLSTNLPGFCSYLPAAGDTRSGAPYDCVTTAHQKSEANTWLVSLDYQITQDKLIYVASRHGYKAGGVNNSGPPVLRSYSPETVTDAEVGFKGDWRLTDNIQLRTNLSVYIARQKGIQRLANITYQGQNASPVLSGSTGDAYGGEFEFTLQAYERLEITGFYSHNHFKYDKLIDDYTVDGATGAVRPCMPTDPGFRFFDTRATNTGVCESTLKLHAQYTPLHKYNLGARYHVLKGEQGDLSFGANYSYQTAMDSGIRAVPGTDHIKGYGLLSASIDWRNIMGSSVSGSIFGTNLTDTNFVQGTFNTGTTLGIVSKVYGEPKMYGVRLKYDF